MTGSYDYENATEAERAAYDRGTEDALNPAGMDLSDVLLLLAVCQDALARNLRELRHS
ncbi:hypothetical protein EV645_5716 [Kribbella rubisoli]|uniref:Uncharacterized protein n=1 Tax=Kribbella rubisoli TaxID=3075929 RepID=A0A4V6MF10_9ACTN|nr:hypothetical protein [Kribbella rubisoli]RZU12446.1 hypothetical protein EV645_5716 [Kribbella rubisoli]